MNTRAPDDAADRQFMAKLGAVAMDLADATSAEDLAVRSEITQVIRALRPDVLARMAAFEGDTFGRRDYLTSFAAGLAPAAVLSVIASSSSEDELTPVMRRLLQRLAAAAETSDAAVARSADHAFREQVRELISRWFLVARDTYNFADMLGGAQPAMASRVTDAEPERVIQTAIEVDTMGVAVWNAVSRLVDGGHLKELLDLVRLAPAGNTVAEQIVNHLATPTLLRAMLRAEPVDFDIVDRLVAQMGIAAARVMLDELAESQVRTVRQGIFDRLTRFGPELGPLVIERLKDKRWYVERNLLALLAEIEYWPDDLPLDTYTVHADNRVRREAVRFLLKIPEKRDQAILTALKQTDMNLVRTGLLAAMDYGSEAAVPLLTKHIADPAFPADLRLLAIRLLQRSRSTLALDALLKLVDGGRNFWNKPKLAPVSAEMLAALTALNATWSRERRATVFLELARNAKEPDVRAAVGVA